MDEIFKKVLQKILFSKKVKSTFNITYLESTFMNEVFKKVLQKTLFNKKEKSTFKKCT